KSIKYRSLSGLIIISPVLIIILTTLGYESGKILISLVPIGVAWFLFALYDGVLFKDKRNIYGFGLIFLFFLLYLIAYLYSPATSSQYGIWKLLQISILSILPSLSLFIFGKCDKKDLKVIEDTITSSALILSLYILYNFFLNGLGSLDSEWFVRETVGDINVNWLSRFFGLSLLIVNSTRFKKNTFLSICISIIILVAALLNGSKTTLFFVIPIIIWMNLKKITSKKSFIKYLFLIMIILFSMVWFLSLFSPDAIMRRFSLTEGTSIERFNMYKTSLRSFSDGNYFTYLFGHGAATIGKSLGYGFTRVYPHNLFLEILYELGITGLLVIIAMPLLIFIKNIKKEKNWTYYAYILFFCYSLTSGDLASNEWIFILFSLNYISMNNNSKYQII
ncbi:MAG: O-antigen ligase family protein, partial [Staphylococcus equorum]|nr:O-antigen ligase family protein [Staphylococcus equorum]